MFVIVRLLGCSAAFVGLEEDWWVGESLERLFNLGPKAGEGEEGDD